MHKNEVRKNKYAYHRYNVEKTYEAGIVLKGNDVKAIRAGDFSLRDATLKLENDEVFIWNIHFHHAPDEIKKKKLLLHKKEISKITSMLKNKRFHGFVLAVKMNAHNRIKLDIGLGTVKKVYEKKTSEKRSTEKRSLERQIEQRLY